MELPPLRPAFLVTRMRDQASWVEGRAGMLYRDLIPDRQGGRFVASHIRILDGGPVADWVHFHAVRFQLIYCERGWIRVVYEDQGGPFVMHPGDCVLQPPLIRHRVLECAADSRVVEVGCPASYDTHADEELSLPTSAVDPSRDFSGQRFVRHEAGKAQWGVSEIDGFEARDTGVEVATGGIVSARVLRRCGGGLPTPRRHDGELLFAFVLCGEAVLESSGWADERLSAGDAFVVPAADRYTLSAVSSDLELLEVTSPARE